MILKRTKSANIQRNQGVQKQQQSISKSSISNSSSLPRVPEHLSRKLKANSKYMQQSAPIAVQNIFRSALRLFTCKMCYNNFEMAQTACISDCGHFFCQNCLVQYCIYKINILQDPLCPQQNCRAKLTIQSSIFQHLPDLVKGKFKQLEKWKQYRNNPNIKICQKEQCKQGFIDLLRTPPQCQKCGEKYCKQCMMSFHEGRCDENFQDKFRQWKRCPNCKIFIQKIEGCNHMTCRCAHQFCFVCLSNWEPGHYQCVDGLQYRLFYRQVEQVPKPKAALSLLCLIILFPLFLVGLLILWIGGFALSLAGGILFAPCLLGKQIKDCCCCCIFWILLLPLAMLFIGVAAPIAFTATVFKPFAYRSVRQYFNSIGFLMEQLCRRR